MNLKDDCGITKLPQNPLFPCVPNTENKKNSILPGTSFPSSTSLFPSVDSSSQSAPTEILPQCSSFPGNKLIPVSDDSSEDENQHDSSTKITDKGVIVLSSDSSSDSSVKLIGRKHRKKDRDKHKKKKRKHKKHKKKSKRSISDVKESSIKYDNSYLEYIPRGSANFIEDIPNLKPEDAFRLDRRGDNNNRAFDQLYKRYVPKYYHKDVINLFHQKGIPTKDQTKKPKRYYLSRKLKNSDYDNNIYVYAKENLFANISNIEFVRIQSNESNQPQNFENFKTQIKFQSFQDDFKEPIGPSISTNKQLILELTKKFNRNLYEEKTNVDQWIDFVRFQDLSYYHEIPNQISDDKQDSSDNNKRYKLCVEKKFDICNKALEFNRRSVPLNLLRLKLLSSFSDELQKDCQDVDTEWKNLCFLFPDAPQIWFEWLYYSLRCQRMANFKANSRTRKIFRYAFSSLSKKILEGHFQTHQIENINIELILINLTFFLSEFLSSIDQTEKAIGIFQALVEFNLYTPSEIDLNLSFDDWFIMFEQFWDSSVARIGEFAHTSDSGWNHFQSQIIKGLSDNIKAKDERNMKVFATEELMNQCEDEIIGQVQSSKLSDKEQIQALCWLHFERMRHSLHWLPASVQLPTHHSMDDIEDPERIVLSDDDIKPFLYRLRNSNSKFYLSLKFLQFLKVPLATYALDSAYSTSDFEIEFYFDSNFPVDFDCSSKSVAKLFEISKKFFFRFEHYSELFVLKRFCLESVADSDYGTNVPLCDEIINKYELKSNQSYQAFVENLFEKLCHSFRDTRFSSILYLLWMQFKIKLYRKGLLKAVVVKKFIKDVLRQFSDNIHFYYVYCNFLFKLNVLEAVKTYLSTIQVFIKNSSHESDILRLALSFVRNLLNLDSILHQFITEVNSKNVTVLPTTSMKDNNLTLVDIKQIALNTLIWIMFKLDVSKFTMDDLNQPGNLVYVLKSISTIESITKQCNSRRKLEEVQAFIFILYLAKDFERTKEFLELILLPDSLCLFDFETSFKISSNFKNNRSLERSFYLLYIQLMLREYLLTKENTYGSISLKHLRELIERALINFPDDPIFLATLAKIETKFTVLTRTRKFFNDYISNSASKLQNYLVRKYLNQIDCDNDHQMYCSIESMYNIFMATLHSEFLILDKSNFDESGYDFYNGMTNRIRHLFEKALNLKEEANKSTINWMGRSLTHCPTIWRLLLRFEEMVRRRQELVFGRKREKNTSILYRALQICPNHKPLYLDVIVLQPNLLQECLDIMMDKQLRVRTTIEEIHLLIQNFEKNKN